MVLQSRTGTTPISSEVWYSKNESNESIIVCICPPSLATCEKYSNHRNLWIMPGETPDLKRLRILPDGSSMQAKESTYNHFPKCLCSASETSGETFWDRLQEIIKVVYLWSVHLLLDHSTRTMMTTLKTQQSASVTSSCALRCSHHYRLEPSLTPQRFSCFMNFDAVIYLVLPLLKQAITYNGSYLLVISRSYC